MVPFNIVRRLSHSGLCVYHHQAYEWYHHILRLRKKWHEDCVGCYCSFCDPCKCDHGSACHIVDLLPCPNCFGRCCKRIEKDTILCRYILTQYVKQDEKYVSIQFSNYTSRLMFMKKYVDKLVPIIPHLEHQIWWHSILADFIRNIPSNSVVVRIDFLENVKHSRGNELGREYYGKRQTTLFITTCWYREYGSNEIIKAYYEFYSSYLTHNTDAFQKFFGIFMESFNFPQHTFRIFLFSDNARTHFHNSSNFLWGSRFFNTFGYYLFWCFDPAYHGKGACDARGACIKRALRFYVLEPGHDVRDVGQLTQFTNTVLHEETTVNGIATNIVFTEFDGYDHAPTLMGNTKWYAFRFGIEEGIVFVRKWPCFCELCLAHNVDWDPARCANMHKCGAWIRKNIHPTDRWIASAATPLQRAAQYQNANFLPSLDSDASSYEVEKILAKRITLDTTEYLVKWKDWDETYNQWLPEHDLEDSGTLLRRFNHRLQNL